MAKKTVLRVVLIDDELLALSYLRTLCESFPEVEVVKIYNDPALFLLEANDLKFDCCISDIVMPNYSGLEIAHRLQPIPFIFTTAHNEYAADAFDIEAVDYLRKPVQKERLLRAIEKVAERIALQNQEANWITTTSKGKMTFKQHEIVSFSTDTFDRRDKQMLLISSEKITIKNKTFEQLIHELAPVEFIRISKSELLAKNVIVGFQGNEVLTSIRNAAGENLKFGLSENYRGWFQSKFNKN